MKKLRKAVSITTVLILIIIMMLILNYKNILRYIYPKEYSELVELYSEKYGVDENLIYAIIKIESNFSTTAKSSKGATGLMQIMEATAKEVAINNNMELDYTNVQEELLKEEINIEIGTIYIQALLTKYGNVELALASYNAGIGTVDNWIEKEILNLDGSDAQNIPYKETNNYVRKVLVTQGVYSKIE